MNRDRRVFKRRKTEASAIVATTEGQELDSAARVVDLSVNGIRIETAALLHTDSRYRVKLAETDAWFDVVVLERVDDTYRCQIDSDWHELEDVIRQSDDLTLLVLESSEPEDDR